MNRRLLAFLVPLILLVLLFLLPTGDIFASRYSASEGSAASYTIIKDSKNQDTIQVTGNGAMVTLADIQAGLGNANNNFLQDLGNGSWQLNVNLLIGQGVTLVLSSATGTSELKMRSQSSVASQIDYASFVYLSTYEGTISIDSVLIHSWDAATNTFDTNYVNGRAYLLAKYNAVLNISNAELSYFGSADGESYGVTWRDINDLANPTQLRTRVTGQVLSSQFHHNYVGVSTSQASNMVFENNVFHSNVLNGFNFGDFSHHFAVKNNMIYNNGAHGLSISRGCNNFIIRNNTVYNNGGYGIYLVDGARQNTLQYNLIHTNSGYGIGANGSQTVGNTWSQNLIYANQGGGIELADGANLGLLVPTLLNAVEHTVSGQASPGATIEIFSDTTNQGQHFEGQVVAAQNGSFSLTIAGNWQATNLTAITIDGTGNASAFSVPLIAPGNTPATGTVIPTSTPTAIKTVTPVPPTNTPISTPLPTEEGGTWQTESFAEANGRWASLALDSTGNPHFSYHRDGLSLNNLWYAHRTGSSWVTEVVDNGYEAGSLSTSLALDKADHPYILYQLGGRDVHPESLKYAYQTMSGWIIETIGIDTYGSTLALDTNGNPHITYSQPGGDKYAYKTSNGWIPEQIDRAGSSLVLDSANDPHITYIASGEVKYAHRIANGWIIETVNTIGNGIGTTSGQKVALALDKAGNPYVSYNFVNGSQNDLKYAYRTASGWVSETVDSATNLHSVGWASSIAVDSAGNPHISYDRIDLGVVKYARRTGNGWSTELVATFGLNTYSETSLVLDSADNPHMLYYQDSGLIYAYKKGQGANSISGQVTGSSNCISDVMITTNTGKRALTNSIGNYIISGLTVGTYTLTASKGDCTFSTLSPVTVPPDAVGQNFIGTSTVVSPLPVILVHGWNDTAASWDTYRNEFLPSIGLTDYGYAVDNIDTGHGDGTSLSIEENAKKLDEYIVRVKRETGAKQVNIVAHSMGGLIARRYIKEYMDVNAPDVHILIMLGTPNAGANLALALALGGIPGFVPSTKELTPSYIINQFNPNNPAPDNVPFYAIAGNYYCLHKIPWNNTFEEQPNDIAVSRKSVFTIPEQGRWTFPDRQTSGCGGDHLGMRSSKEYDGGKEIFERYVGPLLLGQMPIIPSEPQTFAVQQINASQVDHLQEESNNLDTLQFTNVQTNTLQPSGRLEFIRILEPTTNASFIIVGQPEQMVVSLRDPSGQVITPNTSNPNIQYMQMAAEFMPITSYTVKNPTSGIWTIIVEANTQTPSVGVSVTALGSLASDLRLTLPILDASPIIYQTISVMAKLHKGDTTVVDAKVSAQFILPNGTTSQITLLDDGLHGDEGANDGLYSYQFTPMTPGLYTALISAESMNSNMPFQRSTVWVIQADGNQVFLPIVLH